MARIETWFNQDLQQAVKVQYIDGNVFSADNQGNVVGVNVFDGGEPATLGGTVSASVIRADGVTVAVTGTLSGNKCSVVLPQSAYTVPGVISIVIKLTSGSDITTVCAVVGNVYMSTTDSVVDPGTIIPSVETLISEIDAAVASIPADYSSLWKSLAPAFSSSASYNPGDYVTYNGNLYICTTAHTGSWSSSHFSVTNVGSGINGALAEFYKADPERTKLAASYTGDNLLANATWTDGSYIGADGTISTAYSYMTYSSLIPVTHPDMYVCAYIPRVRLATFRIHGYDAEGNWLSQLGYCSTTEMEIGKCNKIYFSNEAITYIRISMCLHYKGNVFLGRTLNDKILTGDANNALVNLTTTEKQNLLDGIQFQEHYWTQNGVVTPYNGMKCSEMFRVEPYTKYVLSYFVPDYGTALHGIYVPAYNLEGTFLRVLSSTNTYAQTSNTPVLLTFYSDEATNIRVVAGLEYSLSLCKAGDDLTSAIIETDYQQFTLNYWEQGTISYNNGTSLTDSTTRLRTTRFIDPEVRFIVAEKNLKFLLYVYNSTGTYLGVLNHGTPIPSTRDWLKFADLQKVQKDLWSTTPGCQFKLIAAYADDDTQTITASAAQNIKFYSKSTGWDDLTSAIVETDYDQFTLDYWVQGTISYTDGTTTNASTMRIRTNGYIDLSTRFIVSEKNVSFLVYVYNRSAQFLGVWNHGEPVEGKSQWLKFVDIQKIYNSLASTAPDCLFKLVAAYDDNTQDILPSAAQNIKFYTALKNKLCATVGLYESWAVCGASYDTGSYEGHGNTYTVAWGYILAKRCGNLSGFTNYAVGGYTTKKFIDSSTTHSLHQAADIDDPKELYVLTFGGNDANHPEEVPVGSLSDITSHSRWQDYPATFYGNYGQIIERLMAHAPNAKFVMTTPSSPWYDTKQTTIDTAVRQIADHYGLPLIVWESDDFMRSDLFIKTMANRHPVPITYSGMAMAFERLFSKCVLEYPAYFTAIS